MKVNAMIQGPTFLENYNSSLSLKGKGNYYVLGIFMNEAQFWEAFKFRR